MLGFCYYQIQDFASASDVYERLSRFYPDIKEYRFYYAQSLYKSNQSSAAQKVCHSLAEEKEFQARVVKLEAAIKFDAQDIAGCKILIDRLRNGTCVTTYNR